MDKWYPPAVRVGAAGTPGTYRFMQSVFAPDQKFDYAEFGFYRADTALNVCERFPNAVLHLFDFHENVEQARSKLEKFSDRVFYYGNSQKYNDSYNWNLLQIIIKRNAVPCFDYCFIDGAHTVAIDALTFFLCDRLTRTGGFIDFDDYGWSLRGSSLDPSRIPAIADQYTDEQIDAKQVAMIVDGLVKTDSRYKEVVPNKIFQKTR